MHETVLRCLMFEMESNLLDLMGSFSGYVTWSNKLFFPVSRKVHFDLMLLTLVTSIGVLLYSFLFSDLRVIE